MVKPITVHVTPIHHPAPWDKYGPSYRVEVRREGRKSPLWSCQYGGRDLGHGNGAADLAHFAGNQVKRQFELKIRKGQRR